MFVTTGLGALVTMGYGLIIFTNSVTELPLVIQEVDDEIRASLANTSSSYKKTKWEIWGSSVYALLSALGFISFHVINFDPAITLYIFVFLILNVPLGLRAFRIYVSENHTDCYFSSLSSKSSSKVFHSTSRSARWKRNYAIVYDILIIRSFLRNHLILTLFCFLVSFSFSVLYCLPSFILCFKKIVFCLIFFSIIY